MKIMWQSNAPWVRTGYGVQTRLTCERIQRSERHKIVGLFAFYGIEGGTINWGDIPVFGRHPQSHPFGADLLSFYSKRVKADVAITLIDAWVQEPDALPPDVRWVPYFPIDHDPVPPLVLEKVRKAFARIVYSRFAEAQMKAAGIDCFYVPHMVDTEALYPVDKAEAREALSLPQDKFIVGMVAANKGYPSRKSYPECIEAFAKFAEKVPNAMLWLHTNPGGNDGMGGVEITSLLNLFGLKDKAFLVNPTEYNSGLDDNFMRNLYSSFDVFLNPAMGEGFGVPIVEAQACGTPVISGNWTSQTEVCCDPSLNVAISEANREFTLQLSFQYRPHPDAICDRLMRVYEMDEVDCDLLSQKCRAFAVENYAADMVTEKYWLPVLDCIAERVNGANALAARFAEASALGRAA